MGRVQRRTSRTTVNNWSKGVGGGGGRRGVRVGCGYVGRGGGNFAMEKVEMEQVVHSHE